MQIEADKEKVISRVLAQIVNNRQQDSSFEALSAGELAGKTAAAAPYSIAQIEQVLNESGITRSAGLSIYHLVEARAQVLYALNIARRDVALLKSSLIYFIADYPVFRWSELRYFFKAERESDIEMIMFELKYDRQYMEEEQEYVWSSKWLWRRTVKGKLAGRKIIGDQAYFDYLTYCATQEITP